MNHLDVNLIVIMVIAITNAYTAYLSWKTKQDIETIEKATNSLTDRLVASTHTASRLAGVEEGRLNEQARAQAEADNVRERPPV